MFDIIIRTDFPAAHLLRGYPGRCQQLHGHTWKVIVTVSGDELNDIGMVMDFREVKKRLNEVLDYLDHSYLNELPEFKDINPTTENIGKYIYHELAKKIEPIQVKSVEVFESDRASAKYYE